MIRTRSLLALTILALLPLGVLLPAGASAQRVVLVEEFGYHT